MAQAWDITPHLPVIGSDGVHVGTVDSVDGARIKLTRADSGDGEHHFVPLDRVARVGSEVILSVPAADAFAGGLGTGALGGAAAGVGAAVGGLGGRMADAGGALRDRAGDTYEDGRAAAAGAAGGAFAWLKWVLVAIGLILLILLARSCLLRTATTTDNMTATDTNTAVTAPDTNMSDANMAVPAPQASPALATGAKGELATYLASNDAAPRTFVLEGIDYATGSAAIPPSYAPKVDDLAAAMKADANAKVTLTGYTDSRGNPAANAALGKRRADGVKSALVAKGVSDAAITTASGGQDAAKQDNTTEEGRAANRRVELTVAAK